MECSSVHSTGNHVLTNDSALLQCSLAFNVTLIKNFLTLLDEEKF